MGPLRPITKGDSSDFAKESLFFALVVSRPKTKIGLQGRESEVGSTKVVIKN